MRTTLSIDDDVLSALRHISEREQIALGDAATRLLRQALEVQAKSARNKSKVFHGFRPIEHKKAVPVSNELIDRMREHDAY